MKKSIFLLSFLFLTGYISAQNGETETIIRGLEQQEVQAVLAKDTAVLLTLWDKNYTVNAPDNKINFPGTSTLDRPVLQRERSGFTRETEFVMIKGNMAICMGSETVVVPGGDPTNAQQMVKRRYTNIWELQQGKWKLAARHANVICKSN
jgi:hypothetical protein